jgi:hypothetical protein
MSFQCEFTEEFLKIRSLGLIVKHLVNIAEKGKMDIEEFADLCSLDFGDKWHMSIDGCLVAEEIARSLEKIGDVEDEGQYHKVEGLACFEPTIRNLFYERLIG